VGGKTGDGAKPGDGNTGDGNTGTAIPGTDGTFPHFPRAR